MVRKYQWGGYDYDENNDNDELQVIIHERTRNTEPQDTVKVSDTTHSMHIPPKPLSNCKICSVSQSFATLPCTDIPRFKYLVPA